jgi:hypothetical protein
MILAKYCSSDISQSQGTLLSRMYEDDDDDDDIGSGGGSDNHGDGRGE